MQHFGPNIVGPAASGKFPLPCNGQQNPQRLAAGFGLGLADEFFAAFRAADAQLAAVLRDPDGLPARRAAKIAVVAVAQPHPQLQEPAVLRSRRLRFRENMRTMARISRPYINSDRIGAMMPR